MSKMKKIESNTEIKALKDEIESLKKKIFKPEPKRNNRFLWYSLNIDWFAGEESKPITLEEKIDALAQSMKVSFYRTEEKESEVKVKKSK